MNPSDEFQKRQDSKPDTWTLAWWEKQFAEVLKAYRGATHAMNIANANYESLMKAIEECRTWLASMDEAAKADRAKIGELQARVERMASWLNAKKNGGMPNES